MTKENMVWMVIDIETDYWKKKKDKLIWDKYLKLLMKDFVEVRENILQEYVSREDQESENKLPHKNTLRQLKVLPWSVAQHYRQ